MKRIWRNPVFDHVTAKTTQRQKTRENASTNSTRQHLTSIICKNIPLHSLPQCVCSHTVCICCSLANNYLANFGYGGGYSTTTHNAGGGADGGGFVSGSQQGSQTTPGGGKVQAYDVLSLAFSNTSRNMAKILCDL